MEQCNAEMSMRELSFRTCGYPLCDCVALWSHVRNHSIWLTCRHIIACQAGPVTMRGDLVHSEGIPQIPQSVRQPSSGPSSDSNRNWEPWQEEKVFCCRMACFKNDFVCYSCCRSHLIATNWTTIGPELFQKQQNGDAVQIDLLSHCSECGSIQI